MYGTSGALDWSQVSGFSFDVHSSERVGYGKTDSTGDGGRVINRDHRIEIIYVVSIFVLAVMSGR